jgi:hypothetical protein
MTETAIATPWLPDASVADEDSDEEPKSPALKPGAGVAKGLVTGSAVDVE